MALSVPKWLASPSAVAFADMAAAKRKDEAGERGMGARLNAGEQVGGGLGSHAFLVFHFRQSPSWGGGEGFERQTKEVGRRLHEAFINEHVDDFFAQTVNPHGAASSEMHNGKLHLRGTDEAARAAHVFSSSSRMTALPQIGQT